jgi:hypothetical protein
MPADAASAPPPEWGGAPEGRKANDGPIIDVEVMEEKKAP